MTEEDFPYFLNYSYPDMGILSNDTYGYGDYDGDGGDGGGGGGSCPRSLTMEELRVLNDYVKYYLDFVGLLTVSAVGLVCNSVAVPVLLSRKMANLFNRTLAMLGEGDVLCC